MTRDELIEHCLSLPGAVVDTPFAPDDEVVKVGGKIFASVGAADAAEPAVGVKCGRDAESAREWRNRYPADVVMAAYVGRYGWNRFRLDGAVPDDELREVVEQSYAYAVAALPRSRRP